MLAYYLISVGIIFLLAVSLFIYSEVYVDGESCTVGAIVIIGAFSAVPFANVVFLLWMIWVVLEEHMVFSNIAASIGKVMNIEVIKPRKNRRLT